MAIALLEAGADPLPADVLGYLAIHFAAAKGHTDVLDTLARMAPSTLNRPSSKGFTPLCCAAIFGRESMVLHLLRLGANQPSVDDTEMACPFAGVVELGHVGVQRILLENAENADVGIYVFGILEAMQSAVRTGRAKSLDAVFDHFDRDGEWCRRFARCSPGGLPMLHHAVSYGRLDVVSVLLAAGADETAVDNDGRRIQQAIGSQDDVDPETETALFGCSRGALRSGLRRGGGKLE